MNIARIAESYSLHLSETEERALTIIFLNIIIEIQLEGEPFNSSIENLKNISSLNDGMISSIVSFLKSVDDETEEYIFKEILDIMRSGVKIDYTYLTDNIQATGDIDITAYTKIPPYPSWIIGNDGEWTPPIAYPDGDGSGMGTLYNWNETKKSWEDILV